MESLCLLSYDISIVSVSLKLSPQQPLKEGGRWNAKWLRLSDLIVFSLVEQKQCCMYSTLNKMNTKPNKNAKCTSKKETREMSPFSKLSKSALKKTVLQYVLKKCVSDQLGWQFGT